MFLVVVLRQYMQNTQQKVSCEIILPYCRPLLTDDRRINEMKVILCHHASFSENAICL